MALATDSLSSAIRAFVAVIEMCLRETAFVEDRHLYLDDLAAANRWLTRLGAGEAATSIAAEIIAPATAKHFTDYWRQGVWGDLESTALETLQRAIRQQL